MGEEVVQKLLPFIENDFAKNEALSDILSAIIVSLEERSEIDVKINNYLDLVPLLREVFEKKYKLQAGNNEYVLSIKTIHEKKLREIFEQIKGKWVIAVDESQHDSETIINSSVFFRGSLAYGMKISEKEEEKVLAVLSSFKVSEDIEEVKRKVELQTYIQNLLVAIYAVTILATQGEEIHSVIIDGPIIRMLAPFLFVTFSKDELEKLFAIDPELEEKLPESSKVFIPEWKKVIFQSEVLNQKSKPVNFNVFEIAAGRLLSYIEKSDTYRKIIKNIKKRNEFSQGKLSNFKREVTSGKRYPGLAVYFFLLRILIDLSKELGFLLISCVKSSERSTEFLRVYYLQALARYLEENKFSSLFEKIKEVSGIKNFQPKSFLEEGKLEKVFLEYGLRDDYIITFSLDFNENSANYISPLEIRRYRSRRINREEIFEREDSEYQMFNMQFGSANEGQETWLEKILLREILNHREYKFLMTYVRTTEVKFPLRIEFPSHLESKTEEIVGSIYLFSAPYRHYGIPIMLKYVDELVRISTGTIQTLAGWLIKERMIAELMNKELKDKMTIKQVINELLGIIKRDFYSRGGTRL